jgi:transcriptional regulator with XRE-family HTH domain
MSSRNPLEAWRIENNLPKHEAAKRLNVSLGHYYEWAAGRSIPSERRAAAVFIVTGVTRSALVAWQEAQAPEQVAV